MWARSGNIRGARERVWRISSRALLISFGRRGMSDACNINTTTDRRRADRQTLRGIFQSREEGAEGAEMAWHFFVVECPISLVIHAPAGSTRGQ